MKEATVNSDPVVCCPDLYSVIFENERVRVLEYRDEPGDRTAPHRHPDSVMVSLAAFSRRVSAGGRSVDVELAPGDVRWVGAQGHVGENTGRTPSRAVFVELKEGAGGLSDDLGPR